MTASKADAIVALGVLSDYISGAANVVVFNDEFNRANENLEASGNWTRVGGSAGWGVVASNAVKSNTTNTNGSAYQCPDLGAASQFVACPFLSDSSPGFACLRLSNEGNFIGMRYANGAVEVYKKIGGTFTFLRSAVTPRGSALFRLEYRDGDGTIRVLKDGAEIIDPSAVGSLTGLPASTRAGLVVRAFATPLLDSFTAGSL